MSSSIAYLSLGMLAGFLLLAHRKSDTPIETFREIRFPMRTQPPLTITSLEGEQVIADPQGVVLDQGQQALRVNSSGIMLYTNSQEVMRITPEGKFLIGESQSVSPINSVGQEDKLTINGGIVLTGSKVLEQKPSSLTAYFYDQQQGEYYDYGGIKIMDRSYEPGQTVYLLGEWIQLSLSSTVTIKSISLNIASSHPSRSVSVPNILHLIGSNDNATWYTMMSKLNQSTSYQGQYLSYNIDTPKPYRHYRLIFTQLTGDTNSQLGPFLQIYGLSFLDTADRLHPPAPMSSNTEVVNGVTYSLTTSITTANVASIIDGEVQSYSANLVGWTYNPIGQNLNQNDFTVLTFPYNNDYYLPSGPMWMSSGLAASLALIATVPFNSSVGIYASYHGSYPIECMRVIHNGASGMVGIGVTMPKSNLSVLGSFDTSYMSCDVLGTKVAVNNTSSNYLHFTSGISNATGFSQILFHSSDGLGTGTKNYYDSSIVSYGGTENQDNRGTLSLSSGTIQLSASASSTINLTSNALSLTTGTISLTSSALTVSSGSMTLSTGAITSTSTGTITSTSTGLNVTTGPVSLTSGAMTLSTGAITSTSTGLNVTTGPVSLTSGAMTLSTGAITSTSTGLNVTTGPVSLTSGVTTLSTGAFTVSSSSVQVLTDLVNVANLLYIRSGKVGVGVSQPNSNLSVLGSLSTSYMYSDASGTRVGINTTSSNAVHMSSGRNSGTGFSQLSFYSSDGTGTGTTNFYDSSIVSYGGTEGQINRGTLGLFSSTIQLTADVVNVNNLLYTRSGKVGVGVSEPTSNLSVLGTFSTSYMYSDTSGTRVGINTTSSNAVHMSSGRENGKGFSELLFYSSDGTGTGTTNYYDSSIVSYGGTEGLANRGTMGLFAETIQMTADVVNLANLLYIKSGKVGIGTTTPSSDLSVLGSFSTSYMYSDPSGTRVGINTTSSNAVHLSSGVGFSQLQFYSSGGDMTYHDTSIISTGGTEVANNKGTLTLNAEQIRMNGAIQFLGGVSFGETFNLSSKISIASGNLGIGTTTPTNPFHIYTEDDKTGFYHTNGTCALQTSMDGQTAIIGTTSPLSASAFPPIKIMCGDYLGMYISKLGVGIGTTNASMDLHVTGSQFIQNGGIYLGTDTSAANSMRMFHQDSVSYLDYPDSFQIRANQTTTNLSPSYYTAVSITNSGYVGIGTTEPNKATSGGNRCYGLDIYGASEKDVSLLRLVNANTTTTYVKGSNIQFVNQYETSSLLMAEIMGGSEVQGINSGKYGCIRFKVKVDYGASDSATLVERASVTSDGLQVGYDTLTTDAQLVFKNNKGFLIIKTLGSAGEASSQSQAGDNWIGTYFGNRNLFITSGGYDSGICIQASDFSANYNNKQSRVGIGSFSPTAILDVYRKEQTIRTTDADNKRGCDPWLLNVTGGKVTVEPTNANLTAPGISLEGTPIALSSSNISTPPRMVINGSSAANQSIIHGNIEFFTAVNGKSDPLVVISGGNETIGGNSTYFGLNSTYLSSIAQLINPFAIYAKSNVVTTGSFIVLSDQRIKKNIVPVNSRQALDIVNQLEVCEYEMRDSIKDPGRKLGVIAQQVQQVFPEAVKRSQDEYVADLLSFVKSVQNEMSECMVQLFDEVDLQEGVRIRLINDRQDSKDVIVVRRLNSRVFTINQTLETDRNWMVYGTLQTGILAVDKPMLGMVALSAIQELSKELRETKDELRETREEMRRQQIQIQALWEAVGSMGVAMKK